MSTTDPQPDQLSVALAALTCGRITQGAVVRATRGRFSARADQYGVNVSESRWRSRSLEGASRLLKIGVYHPARQT